MESVDDGQLMARYQRGDITAFEILYGRHKGPLYRYLLRYVRNAAAAADLFQEVWSKVIANRARYESRAKFATYLFHIAHNCAIDHHRRGVTSIAGRGDEAQTLTEAQCPEHELPDRIAEFDQQQAALLAAVAQLPAPQREVFLLHEETGLGIEDIARITGVGAETAKSRLRYAIRKLKSALLEASGEFAAGPDVRPVRAVR
jgi:RNA polymerase sigma-70 factor (ECF subfamily)